MSNWVVAGIVVGALLLVLLAGPYLAQGFVKGSSSRGNGSFGILDELFHPIQKDAGVQIQEHHRHRAEAEAGDGDDPEQVTPPTR